MDVISSRRRRAAVSALAVVSVLAVAVTAQQRAPQLTEAQSALQKQYPYPVVRDQRGTVPPGPRPLPAPPFGDGPWIWPTMEQRDIKVSIVTRGLSHPWSVAFLPDGAMLTDLRHGNSV